MLKSDLIKQLTDQLIDQFPHLTETVVKESVNILMDYIIQQLAQGGRLEIRGFGSLFAQSMPPRLARNPKTGQKILLAAHYRLRFRAAKLLRLQINSPKMKGKA